MTTELSPLHELLIDVAVAAREVVEICRTEDVELPLFVVAPLLRLRDALEASDAQRDAVLARMDEAAR